MKFFKPRWWLARKILGDPIAILYGCSVNRQGQHGAVEIPNEGHRLIIDNELGSAKFVQAVRFTPTDKSAVDSLIREVQYGGE